MINLFIRAFLCLLLLTSRHAFAAEPYSSIEELIANQKLIRVVLDSGPNFGNQTSSINLMKRIEALGFHGTFEVIYPDDITDKVITLFNLPKQIPSYYEYKNDDKGVIHFINYTEYFNRLKNNQIPSITLSVTGALENDKMHGCLENKECAPYAFDHKFAEFSNSQLFLAMNPWFTSATSPEDTAADYIYTWNAAPKEISSKGTYWIYPHADYDQAKNYLNSHPELTTEKPALKPLIAAIDAKTINVLPVYGYEILKYDYDYGNFPANIIQIITGARYAQLHGASDYNKPLVITVYYNYEKEANELMQFISAANTNNHSENPGLESMKETIKTLGLNQPNVFSVATISDPATINKIKQLKSGQILLISMGSLPNTVFDGLYTYIANNIWPQIREGQNTLNNLLLTGKPHFRCREQWEPRLDLITDTSLKTRLEDFYTMGQNAKPGFCSGINSWTNNDKVYQNFGELLISSNDTNSSFSRYFADLKIDAMKPKNDRIHFALEEVLKLVNEKQLSK